LCSNLAEIFTFDGLLDLYNFCITPRHKIKAYSAPRPFFRQMPTLTLIKHCFKLDVKPNSWRRLGAVALYELVFTGRMPQSGKLPVLNLLTGQKIRFFAPQGRLVDRFTSILAWPTGTWVRLAVQNFTSIGAGGRGGNGMRPQNIKNFHFLIKSRLAGANPLTDF